MKDWLKDLNLDLILTGTSWDSDIENLFINHGKKLEILTACYLDHWTNYRRRFGYPEDWLPNLPDIVFVGDEYAYKLAIKNGFLKNILSWVENPYFEEIAQQAKILATKNNRRKNNNKLKLLYVSEPITEHALKKYGDESYFGYTEFEIVRDIIDIVNEFDSPVIEFRIRLHSSEKEDKYSELLDRQKLNIYVSDRKCSLIEDCVWSDVVIGAETMALVISLIIVKKTIFKIIFKYEIKLQKILF